MGCILQSRTRVVPEGFPLRGKVAVASGDAHEESVVLLEDGRVGDIRNRGVFGRSVHLGQDFLRQSLGDAVQVDGAAGFSDAFGFGFGEGLDMAPGGVLWDGVLVNQLIDVRCALCRRLNGRE